MLDLSTIYGLPLDTADRIVKSEGFEPAVTDYVSLRGKLGNDARVLRAKMNGKRVEMVVGWFDTHINGENDGELQ